MVIECKPSGSFVSFTDDYSHFSMVFLINKKSEAFEKFREYKAIVEAKFGKKIAVLRCDNGGEYLSKQQSEYYKKKGINLETTVPYTPQSNGVAERLNRTLEEKAWTMLIDARLPKLMWGEAVLTATYLLNRSPTSALSLMIRLLQNCGTVHSLTSAM